MERLPLPTPSPSQAPLTPETLCRVIPRSCWDQLPARFRRLLIHDALLMAPSPAAPHSRASFNPSDTPVPPAYDFGTPLPYDTRRENITGASSRKAAVESPTAEIASQVTIRMEVCRLARLEPPADETSRDSTNLSECPNLNVGLAVALSRWVEVMEMLLVEGEVGEACRFIFDLCRKTRWGRHVPSPDVLADLRPEFAELFHDGNLLSQPSLKLAYSSLSAALASLCSASLEIPKKAQCHTLEETCLAFCDAREQQCDLLLIQLRAADSAENLVQLENISCGVMALSPMLAEPYLARAGIYLNAGRRRDCIEDILLYFWWSKQAVFPDKHALAYLRMAEAYLGELEHKSQSEGALLEDSMWSSLADRAESSLQLAIQFDAGRTRLSTSRQMQHLLQRIETLRSARRLPAEFMDSPVVPTVGAEQGTSADDEAKDYGVPWPIDLSAGIPDIVLFSRTPNIGTSHKHDPLDLLFLDARHVLDVLSTMSALAQRSAAFAHRNAECLHWKYRPKPVHVNMQAPVVERLAHAILCLLVARQIGERTANPGPKAEKKRTTDFTMEETHHDRSCCSLLTGLIFCRTLTRAQGAEVDRMLSLLVLASKDMDYMRRTFPWLELDDGEKSMPLAATSEESAPGPRVGSDESGQNEGTGFGGSQQSWGHSVLLFKLQQVWLGWLAASHSVMGGPPELHRSRFAVQTPTDNFSRQEQLTMMSDQTKRSPSSMSSSSISEQMMEQASEQMQDSEQMQVGEAVMSDRSLPSVATRQVTEILEPSVFAARVLEVEEVHDSARRHLLGSRAAATYKALNPTGSGGIVPLVTSTQDISQRRLWALSGFLPPGRAEKTPPRHSTSTSSGHSLMSTLLRSEDAPQEDDDDDPVKRMKPPNPRLRWRPLLDELMSGCPEDWCMNPCILHPVTWCYDPQALADPFRVFSWILHCQCAGGEKAKWTSEESVVQGAPFDSPVPCLNSETPPVLETIWTHLMPQLKSMSSVFHAREARDFAWARDMSSAVAPDAAQSQPASKPTTHLRPPSARNKKHADKSSSKSSARGSAPLVQRDGIVAQHVHVKLTDELRERIAEEEEEERRNQDHRADIERELGELKMRRHNLSLDMEFRDYVTLASVRHMQEDWWGQGGRTAAAYRQHIDKNSGTVPTWNPAPEACVPLQLKITASVGRPWKAVKAASFRRVTYDAIDARTLLCTGVGLLGMCTWFDALMKATPHSYIQTRHCEEHFLEKLRVKTENTRGMRAQVAAAAAQTTSTLVVSGSKTGKVGPPPGLGTAEPRTPAQLSAAGGFWPQAPPGTPRSAVDKIIRPRAVLGPDGVVRRPCPRRPDDAFQPVKSQLLALGELPQMRPREPTAKYQTSRRFQPTVPPSPRTIIHPTAAVPIGKTCQIYDSESKLLEHLVRESVSRKVTAAQMQLLLGVTVRAEPLLAEMGLMYLGAANLPTRRDFLPWDSILAGYGHISKNWPGDADQFSEQTLGGTKTMPVRESRAVETVGGGTLCMPDPLAFVTRSWDLPGYSKQAEGLGPRLVRLRKLGGGHPSLNLFQSLSDRRCGNAAFCTKLVAPETPGTPAMGSLGQWRCQNCECAWYCSAICQATHRVAHEFECKGLQALRTAVAGFEEHGHENTRLLLAEILEDMLSKPLSMVSSADALVDKTVLTTSLENAISGKTVELKPATANGELCTGSDSIISSNRSRSVDKPSPRSDRPSFLRGGPSTRDIETVTLKITPASGKSLGPVLNTALMLLIPEGRSLWKVGIGAEMPSGKDARDPSPALQPPALGLFDVRVSHAHNAAGAARLLSRWASATHYMPALKAALEDGLLFAMLTGASQTQNFCDRDHQLRAAVTVLCHRMALHIAASKDWKILGPLVRIPEQFQETGVPPLDFAQYSAFYAFLKPRRLPFVQLQPFMPVVCIIWGRRLQEALLALPYLLEPQQEKKASGRCKVSNRVGTFWDVAAEYISDLQLVDTVHLDVLTGRTYFLLYTEATARAQSQGHEAWILMLDASRGMQVVASPIPARELRRCAL
eukprot:TRINITY_DN12577_c1_g1_i1.p1 TRINITY_DN12577_c1_g1~~TRINITY_DN12577_c1_g1_i1.p1  ORF type:complete len:2024 (+),score=331.07 TRINITY_DN12577_c1_g1_i1:173-6244(+)